MALELVLVEVDAMFTAVERLLFEFVVFVLPVDMAVEDVLRTVVTLYGMIIAVERLVVAIVVLFGGLVGITVEDMRENVVLFDSMVVTIERLAIVVLTGILRVVVAELMTLSVEALELLCRDILLVWL